MVAEDNPVIKLRPVALDIIVAYDAVAEPRGVADTTDAAGAVCRCGSPVNVISRNDAV